MTIDDRARVGLVGTGWWSTHMHLPALVSNPNAEVVGVCDLDSARAREVADRFDVPFAVTSVGQLLGLGLDAVVVATPHDAHYEPAAAAISAGVDVLVEKPMTIDPGQAWDLVWRAQAAGVALHVGHTYPYSRHANYLRTAIGRGDLGDLNLTTALFSSSVHQFYSGDVEFMQRRVGALYPTGQSTYASAARGGGHLFTQITHAASVVLWVTGRVAARGIGVRASPRVPGGPGGQPGGDLRRRVAGRHRRHGEHTRAPLQGRRVQVLRLLRPCPAQYGLGHT